MAEAPPPPPPPPPPSGLSYNEFKKWRKDNNIKGTQKDISDAWKLYSPTHTATKTSAKKSPTKQTKKTSTTKKRVPRKLREECTREITKEEFLESVDTAPLPFAVLLSYHKKSGHVEDGYYLFFYREEDDIMVTSAGVLLKDVSFHNVHVASTKNTQTRPIRDYLLDIMSPFGRRKPQLLLSLNLQKYISLNRPGCREFEFVIDESLKEVFKWRANSVINVFPGFGGARIPPISEIYGNGVITWDPRLDDGTARILVHGVWVFSVIINDRDLFLYAKRTKEWIPIMERFVTVTREKYRLYV